MKERPILFNGEMVRAILAGRKTQTRRIVKPQPDFVTKDGIPFVFTDDDQRFGRLGKAITCKYGQVGDQLWVREAWSADFPEVFYLADKHRVHIDDIEGTHRSQLLKYFDTQRVDSRPSIHMPRWASRITMEVTGIRVERLQNISEDDAKAEGCLPVVHNDGTVDCGTRKTNFRILWESINGAGSWQENPFVWVVEFKQEKVKPTK